MAVTLPYQFDTSGVVKGVLRGVSAFLLVVILPGVPYTLLVRHDIAAAALLLIIGAMAAAFARIVLRNLEGSRGTISADSVVVEPSRLLGVRLSRPASSSHEPSGIWVSILDAIWRSRFRCHSKR